VLDSRRCISYLTIELRGNIPEPHRSGVGDWLFGCDVCQEVCPWNRKAPSTSEPAFQSAPAIASLDLAELLGLTEEEFRRRFRGTALMRAGRSGVLRNAAIVLANQGDANALPALHKALNDAAESVRDTAHWAIRKLAVAGPNNDVDSLAVY
jgi:epoxyqueuosine reductase